MATPPVADPCVELKIHYGTSAGQYGLNVLHYEPDTVPTVTSPFAQATNFIIAWAGSNMGMWLAALSTDTFIASLTARVLGPSSGPSAERPEGGFGTYGDAALSFGTAALIRWFGAGTAREEAKTYLPNIPVSAFIEEVLQPAYLTALGNIITAETTPLTANGTTYKRCAIKRTTGVPWQITDGIPRNKVCFLRRRLLPERSL